MTSGELLEKLSSTAIEYSKDAKESVVRNNHMNELKPDEKIKQEHIDAVLVDFINYVGGKQGMDYAMYTIDLKEEG